MKDRKETLEVGINITSASSAFWFLFTFGDFHQPSSSQQCPPGCSCYRIYKPLPQSQPPAAYNPLGLLIVSVHSPPEAPEIVQKMIQLNLGKGCPKLKTHRLVQSHLRWSASQMSSNEPHLLVLM